MTTYHSIWLMPAEKDLAFLTELNHQLAGIFGTQIFCPHLTLVEDQPRSADEMSELLARDFAGEHAFECPVSTISETPMFYRSLFAAFEAKGQLLALKEKAISAFGKGDLKTFVPHISLAYGAPDEAKPAAIDYLHRTLTGRPIRFDSIAVAESAQTIPIEEWRIAHDHSLKPIRPAS